jgi:citrate synthase
MAGAGRRQELLTSRQAADRLGVKLETLYAYAARGLIRGAAGPSGQRGTRYPPDEVEAFLARRRATRDPQVAAARALFWGRPVIESAVSRTDGGRLSYRGHDAVALAESACFEQVAELLWTGTLPENVAPWPAADRRALPPAGGGPVRLETLLRMTAWFAWEARRQDERAEPIRAADVAARAKEAVVRLVAGLAAERGASLTAASRGPMAARVLSALGGRGGPEATRMVDRALVLSAEHELNASTFAARVAASTGAHPYAVLSAGLAAISGPKHGALSGVLEALLATAPDPDGELPGFGHKLYPEGDPRAPPLLAAARAARTGERALRRSIGRHADLDAVLALVDTVAARGGPAPTLDVGLVATACALGLPPASASLLFALGRIAGWTAHAIEQYALGEIIRPRARYVGPASSKRADPNENAGPASKNGNERSER